jgi:hypothetical protein
LQLFRRIGAGSTVYTGGASRERLIFLGAGAGARRIADADPYLRMIQEGRSEALRDADRAMLRPEWRG